MLFITKEPRYTGREGERRKGEGGSEVEGTKGLGLSRDGPFRDAELPAIHGERAVGGEGASSRDGRAVVEEHGVAGSDRARGGGRDRCGRGGFGLLKCGYKNDRGHGYRDGGEEGILQTHETNLFGEIGPRKNLTIDVVDSHAVQLQSTEITIEELPVAAFPAAAWTRSARRASPRGRHRAERKEALANSGENTHRDNYCSLS